MRRIIAALPVLGALLALAVPASAQQGFPSYHDVTSMSPTSPGAWRSGLYGFQNPATLAWQRETELMLDWTSPSSTVHLPSRQGLYMAVPSIGLGIVNRNYDSLKVRDMRVSFGVGGEDIGIGFGYGWSDGDAGKLARKDLWTMGMLLRPTKYFSLGISGTVTGDGRNNEVVGDLAVRPFGTDRFTMFADFSKREGQPVEKGNWSAGALVEIIPGLRAFGRYFDTKAVSAGMQISIGWAGLALQNHSGGNENPQWVSGSIRIGGKDRDITDAIPRPYLWVPIELRGSLGYQRFKWFDGRSTLAELLDWIDKSTRDTDVHGIAINLSGFGANRELLWEVREKLRAFQRAGKRVVIFIDRADIELYAFASVADKLVLDPSGNLMLTGFVMGRTFMKGALDKLGVGYDEFRFFTYKSAMENYSREKMSDADRVQRQAYVDGVYDVTRRDIAEGRHVPADTVDLWVNTMGLFTPQGAIAHGLVDTLARWDDIQAYVASLEHRKPVWTAPRSLAAYNEPSDARWGKLPHIAVIYALGACAMDEGINARSLVKDVMRAVNNPEIRAIVLRVDSPGGDAMASDIIAEALKKAKGRKPVIVSQGSVAASGGYWLSMYADTIVAAPMTVTGSIGVIGGWFYDQGLKEKLGLTTDYVKAGAHADIGFGFTLPFVGAGIPDRKLTPEERAIVENMIRSSYRDFVGKVAAGRKLPESRVDSLGQGRIWTGTAGNRNGLVDIVGGLDDAIRIARERAGIAPDEDIAVVSMPEPGLIDLSGLLPHLLGVTQPPMNRLVTDIIFRLRNNGLPLPMMPMDVVGVEIPEY